MMSLLGLLLLLLAVLLFFLYLTYRPPDYVFTYFQRRWPDVLWCISTNKKIIALTIDDGPSQYTSDISAVLKANDVKATFFVIGSHISGYQNVLKELIANGCELANHGMHDEAARSLPLDVLQSQIEATQDKVDQIYQSIQSGEQAPKLFRPGHGWYSTQMRAMLEKKGFRLVLGNVYPHDPQIRFWRLNTWHILSMVKPGAIIICHDGRGWTVPMLKAALPELKKRGYKITTITSLLQESES